MNIAFNRQDARDKLTQSMRIAIRCGDIDTAGNIAAVLASAFNAFDRIDHSEPRRDVERQFAERHQMIADYFFEREQETLVIEQRKLDNMTLEELASMRARLESL